MKDWCYLVSIAVLSVALVFVSYTVGTLDAKVSALEIRVKYEHDRNLDIDRRLSHHLIWDDVQSTSSVRAIVHAEVIKYLYK